MKYIKRFESKTEDPKFKIGETVYCVRSTKIITTDIPYEIIDILTLDKGGCINQNYYVVKEIESGVELKDCEYAEERFISEIEYNANKYNI